MKNTLDYYPFEQFKNLIIVCLVGTWKDLLEWVWVAFEIGFSYSYEIQIQQMTIERNIYVLLSCKTGIKHKHCG